MTWLSSVDLAINEGPAVELTSHPTQESRVMRMLRDYHLRSVGTPSQSQRRGRPSTRSHSVKILKFSGLETVDSHAGYSKGHIIPLSRTLFLQEKLPSQSGTLTEPRVDVDCSS